MAFRPGRGSLVGIPAPDGSCVALGAILPGAPLVEAKTRRSIFFQAHVSDCSCQFLNARKSLKKRRLSVFFVFDRFLLDTSEIGS